MANVNGWRSTGTADVMVFRPTMDEFANFSKYVEYMENCGAHLKCGIAKVIPPSEWHPRPNRIGDYSDIDNFVIQSPVREKFVGQSGCYTKYNTVFKKSMTVAEYRQMTENIKYKPPKTNSDDLHELERHYWRNLLYHEPIYGADTPGSIYQSGIDQWNINRLGTILDMLGNECNVEIKGVNTAYLYFGMWKTTFPWHVEDMDLYSINYLHFGAPKFWYGIAASSAERFEGLTAQLFSQSAAECKAFLRHKMHLVSPTLLKTHSIQFGTMVQYAGEFMITFPKGYHAGFNTGYNCAESTNFASERWIDYGKKALLCTCRDDTVRIDMIPFMRKYKPDEFDKWYEYWYLARSSTSLTNKNGRSKRHPICNIIDDDQKPSTSMVVASGKKRKLSNESTIGKNKDWMKPIDKLWVWKRADFDAERNYNYQMSLEDPHCCVCQYFVPKSLCKKVDQIPKSSRRVVKNLCFAKDPMAAVEPPESYDQLLVCNRCSIVVHAGCYASPSIDIDDTASWTCMRCEDAGRDRVECRLCCLRGGCLVPVDTYGYVHVICALFHRKAQFDNPTKRRCVHFRSDYEKSNASNYHCAFCDSDTGDMVTCANCTPSDALVFHPTCGRAAGVSYEFRDWPVLVAAVCPNHAVGSDVENDLPAIQVGEKVILWLDEGANVQRGLVLFKKKETFCVVDFQDGTVSTDLYPQDIRECECAASACNGEHVSGAKVRVDWTDGQIYNGVFRRSTTSYTYTVALNSDTNDDNQQVEVLRDEIYGSNEVIPSTVLERLKENNAKRRSM